MARRLEPGGKLVLASHNPGKLAELEALLAPHGIRLIGAGSLGLAAPSEDAPDFAGNARLKALSATASGLPALADDSGFCVGALGGRPGVHSARWAGPSGDFARAMARIKEEMGEPTDDRAWFVAALSLAWPDRHTETFLGRVDGTLVFPPRGRNGFGYDPMFRPPDSDLTFGEMAPAEKHARSHRARAFAALRAACLP